MVRVPACVLSAMGCDAKHLCVCVAFSLKRSCLAAARSVPCPRCPRCARSWTRLLLPALVGVFLAVYIDLDPFSAECKGDAFLSFPPFPEARLRAGCSNTAAFPQCHQYPPGEPGSEVPCYRSRDRVCRSASAGLSVLVLPVAGTGGAGRSRCAGSSPGWHRRVPTGSPSSHQHHLPLKCNFNVISEEPVPHNHFTVVLATWGLVSKSPGGLPAPSWLLVTLTVTAEPERCEGPLQSTGQVSAFRQVMELTRGFEVKDELSKLRSVTGVCPGCHGPVGQRSPGTGVFSPGLGVGGDFLVCCGLSPA